MRRKIQLLAVLCCVMVMIFTGCGTSEKEVDYSTYDFAGVHWTRDAECDVETLCFRTNGEFQYSCGCGNPVNDADVVETYSYDDETKMFTLNCYEEIEGMITEIKLVNCDGETLELDFDGEIRTFMKAE